MFSLQRKVSIKIIHYYLRIFIYHTKQTNNKSYIYLVCEKRENC